MKRCSKSLNREMQIQIHINTTHPKERLPKRLIKRLLFASVAEDVNKKLLFTAVCKLV